jgi:hypothetical protein
VTTESGGTPDEYWQRPTEPAPQDPPVAEPPPRFGDGTLSGPRFGETPSPWQRPPHRPESVTPAEPAPTPGYAGPPPTQAPPHGWRPPFVVQPAAPRQLPAQDRDQLNAGERSARTLTLGVGMIAGAIVLILTCLLCSRLLF